MFSVFKALPLHLALLLSLIPLLSLHAEEAAPKVVIVVGTHHYSPQKSMPLFAKELEKLGLETVLINPAWDPEKDKRGLPGLEALADADLALFFTRFLKLEDEQLKHITSYLASAKPVVGFRTSTHGFNYPKGDANFAWNKDFGRDALGTPYLIHLKGSTQLRVAEGADQHPILTGVTPPDTWISRGTLYLTDLATEGVTPLLTGTGTSKHSGKVTNGFGTHQLEKTMSDVVAWTWTNKWGGQTFTTSLGHTGDFAVEPSMRVMVNGIFWALGRPVPAPEQTIGTFSLGGKKKK